MSVDMHESIQCSFTEINEMTLNAMFHLNPIWRSRLLFVQPPQTQGDGREPR